MRTRVLNIFLLVAAAAIWGAVALRVADGTTGDSYRTDAATTVPATKALSTTRIQYRADYRDPFHPASRVSIATPPVDRRVARWPSLRLLGVVENTALVLVEDDVVILPKSGTWNSIEEFDDFTIENIWNDSIAVRIGSEQKHFTLSK